MEAFDRYAWMLREHLSQPYIYRIHEEGGSFTVPVEEEVPAEARGMVRTAQKCCRELAHLLEEAKVAKGDFFEFYTCWAGEEDFPREAALDREVQLAGFPWEKGLNPKEKQYIRIYSSD